jgi:hypothetical protein
MMAGRKGLAVRGYLLHLTHYDPMWVRRKARERRFDLEVALEMVEALAEEKFNLLVIDCADGVKYSSHPELAKKYSAPMGDLEKLAAAARDGGLDVAPKLNFAQSRFHQHNDWMRGRKEEWYEHFDDEAYWKKALELVDELIGVCRPKRYFHIGMDEDHDRSHAQYVAAIKRARAGLRERKLKTLIWNDTGTEWAAGLVHAEKSLLAEKAIPKDVVQVIWRYDAVPAAAIRRVGREGFEVWGAPGWHRPKVTAEFRDAVMSAGGKGLLMTTWRPVRRSTRRDMLAGIRRMGPVYRGEG